MVQIKAQPIPSELEEALDDLQYPGDFHTGDVHDLPHPGLRVASMSDPLAFPLLPSQAEQLAAVARQCPHGKGLQTLVDTSVRDCLEVDASEVIFSNPDWFTAVDKLVRLAAQNLGLPADNVTCQLYKLLLYRKGSHFKPHRDTEKVSGMFATLSIQLQSSFTGGELVLNHRGTRIVYTSGADDASSQHSTFYTAFFADVEHEILPVQEGYRLVLVYNLKWIGNGTPPSAEQSQLHVVANEIRHIADKSPAGAWILAFGIEHQYTPSSLSKDGIGALKGKDRAKVGALISAAKEAKIGELEVLLLMLSRTDHQSGEGDCYSGDFEVYETEEGDISIDDIYRADGSHCSLDLSFINLDGIVKDEINFVMEDEGGVEYTGNEGATRETTYGATCVVLWPKEKTVEVLSGSDENLSFVLEEAKGNEQATADRILDCLKECISSHADDSSAWSTLDPIFDFCLEHKLEHQTNRAIQLAAEISGPTGRLPIDVKLSQVVTTFGWKTVSNTVNSYLCPADISSMREIESRIKTLHRLGSDIPYPVQVDAVVAVVEFVRRKKSVVLWNSHTSDIDDKERARVWGLLLASLDRMHVSPQQKGRTIDTTDLIARLKDLCVQVDEKEVAAMESALSKRSMVLTLTPDPLRSVQSAIRCHISKLQSKRFCLEVEYVVKNKILPSSYVQQRIDPWGVLRPTGDRNWSSFLLLLERAMSTKLMKPKCEKHFQLFLSTVPSLSERVRRSIRSALLGAQVTLNTQEVRRQIMQAVQQADDFVAEKALIEKVRTLQGRTAIPPKNVQVKYPANNFGGFPQVQSFLMSTKMETRITGYGSVIVARQVLKSFQNRLPHGIQSAAGGVGKNSYIHLKKPYAAEREEWLRHCSEKTALNKAQAELKQVQARLRKSAAEEEGKQPAIKKQKTNHIPNRQAGAAGVSINHLGDDEVSPTKVIEEVIIID